MDPALIAISIPIVAIVCGIGIGMLSIWSEHKRKAQLLEQLHRERMVALDKGVEPPPIAAGLVGFLSDKGPKPPVSPRTQWPKAVRNGLMLLFGGLVLYFAIDHAGGEPGAPFALIPTAIGVANLIYAAILWNQANVEPPKA
ncbi:MAG TPA: hypothetical protein VK624_21285 [Steroidobacteraceae bacterium]|nr:hypothetical protein [Steroidobacteraceae bacterium]